MFPALGAGVPINMIANKKRVATLTTNILNPFLVGMGLITLLSFKSMPSTSDAIKWALTSIACSILPIFAVVIYLLHNNRLGNFFINARAERSKVYLLAGACSITGSIVLARLGAPPVLLATYIAGLLAIVIFMLINLMWKISVHTAFIAASATILIVMYGFVGAVGAALVPPTAWARIELEEHSLAQAVSGAVLAAVIVFVVFYFFGLVGGPA
ncbi:MAG: hypothetical protein Q7R57_09275 [Dehalococcoidales bacterium]|nr:hypothetical protein [Dehalococcoidales bacterium]